MGEGADSGEQAFSARTEVPTDGGAQSPGTCHTRSVASPWFGDPASAQEAVRMVRRRLSHKQLLSTGAEPSPVSDLTSQEYRVVAAVLCEVAAKRRDVLI